MIFLHFYRQERKHRLHSTFYSGPHDQKSTIYPSKRQFCRHCTRFTLIGTLLENVKYQDRKHRMKANKGVIIKKVRRFYWGHTFTIFAALNFEVKIWALQKSRWKKRNLITRAWQYEKQWLFYCKLGAREGRVCRTGAQFDRINPPACCGGGWGMRFQFSMCGGSGGLIVILQIVFEQGLTYGGPWWRAGIIFALQLAPMCNGWRGLIGCLGRTFPPTS